MRGPLKLGNKTFGIFFQIPEMTNYVSCVVTQLVIKMYLLTILCHCYTRMLTQQITLTALRARKIDSSKPIASDC